MTPESPVINKFLQLLDEVINNSLTDLHVSVGNFPYIRTPNRDVEPVESFGILTNNDVLRIIDFTGSINTQELEETLEGMNYIYEFKGNRFRANVSKNNEGLAIAFRTIKKKVPTAESVGLDADMLNILNADKGLILITGGTGSGKTTTLVAMLDYLNRTQHRHIITVEDPIEYIFQNQKSLIHQKQVGKHVSSFEQAIKDAMREDPDIIMVGEMRDMETISAVLTLAETGHLVLSTLHTNDVVQTFDRLVYAFPAQMQSQVRVQLALTLVAIIGQLILPKIDNSGNIAAREIFMNTDATRNLIIEGSISHLYSIMEIGKKEGMMLMDHRLAEMFTKELISYETLMSHVKNPNILTQLGIIRS